MSNPPGHPLFLISQPTFSRPPPPPALLWQYYTHTPHAHTPRQEPLTRIYVSLWKKALSPFSGAQKKAPGANDEAGACVMRYIRERQIKARARQGGRAQCTCGPSIRRVCTAFDTHRDGRVGGRVVGERLETRASVRVCIRVKIKRILALAARAKGNWEYREKYTNLTLQRRCRVARKKKK